MPSSARKGAYYKGRTKRYLERLGYEVADLEISRILHTPNGLVPVKRDQFASDLLAVSGTDCVFVQSKGGTSPADISGAVRKFAAHTFPPFVKLWIAVWKTGAHAPAIVDVRERVHFADLA